MNTISRNKIILWLVVVCMLAGMFVTTGMPAEVYAGEVPWSGSGTSEDPYLIEDPDDLAALSNSENMGYWGAYFEQTADITLPDVAGDDSNWIPIGDFDNKFTGTYDGGNNTIYNLTINDDFLTDIGLFGAIAGIVKDLSLENAYISSILDTTTVCIGGIAGVNGGQILNCHFNGSISGAADSEVGGIAGITTARDGSSIIQCSSSGNISGDDNAYCVGGIVGFNYTLVSKCINNAEVTAGNLSTDDSVNVGGIAGAAGLVDKCYNTGNVSGGDGTNVGGLVGEPEMIRDSYNTGDVTGGDNAIIGGVAGHNYGEVSNCYSTGNVSGGENSNIGGLIGYNEAGDGSINGCYYDRTTSGQSDEGKGIPKTTADMMKQETYVGWDFINTWDIAENRGYPTLLPPVWSGDGSEENPYLVESAAHLKDVRNKITENGGDVYFRQTADIALNTAADGESNWVPIGNASTRFKGTYDGGGFKISNLTIADSSERYTGLFGYVENGVLNNIHLDSVNITSNGINTGGLVGYNSEGTINNCSGEGSITGGGITGGLVGFNNGDITNSCSNFNINVDTNDDKDVGGLAGYNMGDITSSFSKGSVNVNDSGGRYVYAGGLTGGSEGTVTDCYSNCSVSLGGSIGGDYVATGGLVAYNYGDVEKCYSTGFVSTAAGITHYGGLVGYYHRGNVTNSYYDSITSGQLDDEGKGIPKTTDDLMKQATFEGWDFENTWYIKEGSSYPVLRWQLPPPEDNNGGGGGSSAADVIDSKGKITADAKLNSSTGIAESEVSASTLSMALRRTAEDSSGIVTLNLTIPSVSGASGYGITLPADSLSSLGVNNLLEINTEVANITLPGGMLAEDAAEGARDITLSVQRADVSAIEDEETRSLIGDRPVIQLSLNIDGEAYFWSNPNAPVTVSIPYTPSEEELADPEHIVIWYIDGAGNVISVPDGRYDPDTGTVVFSTTHFSTFAVSYVQKTFSDLTGAEWARNAIEVMASKGIINGTGKERYSPDANITRADYLVLLVKTLGLTADFDGNFSDVAENTYYYNAVGTAKELGIASGEPDGTFNPTENISRQDMMALTARALEKFKGLETSTDNTVLDRFDDKGDIADYALSSMAALVKAGLIAGYGNSLNPLSNTTRAEAAVFLYNIYNRY